MIKLKIDVSMENSGEFNSSCSGSFCEVFQSEGVSIEELFNSFIYALPKHEFPSFDIIEVFKNGKPVAHIEV